MVALKRIDDTFPHLAQIDHDLDNLDPNLPL